MTIETKDVTLIENIDENYISTYKKGSLVGTNDNDIIRADLSDYQPTGKNNIKANKGLTISARNGDDVITGTQYNDKISGGSGTNIINLSTQNDFGKDTVTLTKNEHLKLLLDIEGSNADEYLNYYIKGKNLVIEVFDGEGIQKGLVTINNYTKKDIIGFNGSLGIYNKNEELIVDLRTFKYQTVFIDENTKYSKITGTWINDYIDGSEYQLYKDKKRTIPIDTYSKRGLSINAGSGDNEITGSKYSDTIKSSSGSDLIYSTQGNDKYTLGKGNDTIVYSGEFNTDTYILTKGESLSFDFDFYDLTSLNDIKFSLIGKDLQISIPRDDGIYGKIVLKNYTKNILKDLNIKLDNSGYTSVANLDELLKLVTLNYDISDSNRKGIITASQYDDVINISNNEKKITINAGKGNNVIKINNTTSFGNIILSEQKVSAKNTIVFDDMAELSFTKSGTNLIISDNNGKLTINGYFGKIKNKSTINIVSDDTPYNMEEYLKNVQLECIGKGKLYGTDNDDTIIATGKATIYTGKGDDVVLSSKGNRTFYFYEGDGNDVIEKGNGIDTIRFAKGTKVTASLEYNIDGSANLILNYGNNGDTVTLMNYDRKKTSYYIGNKKYSMSSVIKNGNHIEIDKYMTHYDGTNNNDVIIDSLIHSSYDKITINAGAGDDYIDAHNDIVYGGAGNDYIHAKDCIVYGEDGNDTIVNYNSSSKNISIYGGNGDDIIVNNQYASIDDIYGEDGDDKIINHGEVRNNIDAGDGDNEVTVSGTVSNGVISGSGNDRIKIEESGTVRNISSGGGNDNIIVEGSVLGNIDAGNGDNTITVLGSTGDINTNSGNNTVSISGVAKNVVTGEGDDIINVSGSVNSVDAGDGDNEIVVKTGAKVTGTISSGSGVDNITVEKSGIVQHISSGNGDDSIIVEGSVTGNLNSGNGNNIITILGSAQNVITGSGKDTVNISGNVNSVNAGGGANEIIVTGMVSNDITSGSGNDIINISGSVNNIDVGSGNDEIVVSGEVLNNVVLGAGNDNITIKGGAEVSGTISGGDGDDTINIFGTVNNLETGEGNNEIVVLGNVLNNIDARYGHNTVTVEKDAKVLGTIFYGSENDNINILGTVNNINTGSGNNNIIIDGELLGTITSGLGNDVITVSGTVNNVNTGDGDNEIVIKTGAEITGTISGGSGDDTYTFHTGSGIKTISDTSGVNKLVFVDVNFSDLKIKYNSWDDKLAITNKNTNDILYISNFKNSKFDELYAFNNTGEFFKYSFINVISDNSIFFSGASGTYYDDRITISGYHNGVINGLSGNDEITLLSKGNVKRILLGSGNNRIKIYEGGKVEEYIFCDSGDDIINVSGKVLGNIYSGNGKNNIFIQRSAEISGTIYSGNGNDTIYVSGSVRDINTGDGKDSITVVEGTTYDLDVGNGDDEIIIESGVIVRGIISGGNGDDNIIVNGRVFYDVNGGNGNDSITVGGNINYHVNGDDGNDEIIIKSGATVSGTISGGEGNDTYTFYTGSGAKTISDTSGSETLIFADTKFSDLVFNYDINNNLFKIINNDLLSGKLKTPDVVTIQNFQDSGFDKLVALDENGEEKEYSLSDYINKINNELDIDTASYVSENQINELNQYITAWNTDSFDSSETIIDTYANNSTNLETLVSVQ